MDSFSGKMAVITGGGSGMGRCLVTQLAEKGCHVAFCDLDDDAMRGTLELCADAGTAGTRVTAHRCDVSAEADLDRFREEIAAQHDTAHINLLFNNAGVSGGQSFVRDDRAQWEKTFDICWGGVYLGCRVFLPMLLEADEAHIVNTSSVNGFWACLGGSMEHTAYSAAKFAVKGFSEALVTDLRVNAPHIHVSVVMPGHIGTSIALNTHRMWSGEPSEMDAAAVERTRERWTRLDTGAAALSDDMVRDLVARSVEDFRDKAPTSAAEAADIMLQGVLDNRWRVLVGDDAVALDRAVREHPERAYEDNFFDFSIGGNPD